MPRAVGITVSHCRCPCRGSGSCRSRTYLKHYGHYCVAITGTANFVAPTCQSIDSDEIVTIYPYYYFCLSWTVCILLGLILIVAHLASLRSFGAAILAPVAPLNLKAMKDIFVVFPFASMNRRPSYLRSPQPEKQKDKSSPSPPDMLGENGG